MVRLIIQIQIANGGYAAHTDPNRKIYIYILSSNTFMLMLPVAVTLTSLLYWSMLESGLALIACSLPTLHNLFSHSFIHPAVDSMRRLLSSTRSSMGSAATTSHERPYYEVSSSKLSNPSQSSKSQSYELSQDFQKLSDVESGDADWSSSIKETYRNKLGAI